MKLLSTLGYFLLIASSLVDAKTSVAPEDGKFLFGAWLDTSPIPGTNEGIDSPSKFNNRLGFNASLFQYAQNVPFDDTTAAPLEQVVNLGTDAIIQLTIYPDDSRIRSWKNYDALDLFTDANILALVKQIGHFVEDANTKILLRLMPEMNGNWMPFGQRPRRFVEVWRAVYNAFQAANLGNNVDFVWAPNPGLNYPYGGFSTSIFTSNNKIVTNIVPGMEAEFTALDTNGDNIFDIKDDPYSPYWPGDEYVDWVGVSNYYFGRVYPWVNNVLPRHSDFETNLISGNVNLYDVYSHIKDKPFIMTETSASFHEYQFRYENGTRIDPVLPIPIGAGNTNIKKEWFESSLGNHSFWDAYPNVKAFCLFEFQKREELTYRNFQVTNISNAEGPEMLSMFLSILDGISGRLIQANYTNTFSTPLGSSERNSSIAVLTSWTVIISSILICISVGNKFLPF